MASAIIVAWNSSAALATEAMPGAAGGVAILTQARGLPAEFQDHFFDTPLAIRVELDGKFLGDATILLTRDETVQLVSFGDISDSKIAPAERQRWAEALQEPRRLGSCERNCPGGLLALYYSLENSVLSVVTTAAERDDSNTRFYALPEGGSRGLILRNYFNAGAGQDWAGRYALEAQGSLGNWTAVGNLQLDQNTDNDRNPRHSIQRLFLQRELEGHFFRAGYFTPDAIGVNRQPRIAGNRAFTTLGVMAGSSDSLSVNSVAASIYPVYVTASREGIVEIYRNGTLINSQPVQPGLQVIDSRQLPGGIYKVEVRLLEDGVVTSRSTELIYKPNNWHDPEQRWRYSVFAGQQQSLFDSERNAQAGDIAAGAVVNYLLHPRVVVGASVQAVGSQIQYGASVDWEAADRARVYANVYQSGGYGAGADAQAIFTYAKGSLVLSHNRAWFDNLRLKESELNGATRYQGISQTSALNLNHRFTDRSSGTVRLSHSVGASNGVGLDLSLYRRGQVYGSDGIWRLSAFDRPAYSGRSQRNRGLELTLNITLGKEGRRMSGSAGTRAASQGSGRDQYASLTYQQELKGRLLRNVSGTASIDRYGLGLSGNTDFKNDVLRGDAYLQRSSLRGGTSAGVNLESTVAFGADRMVATGEALSADAGLIVDVVSDVDGLALRADDSGGGGGGELQPGRNFVPVTAFKAGVLQFDFGGAHAPTAVIQPATSSYHLNKGGVGYQQIRVMKTVTVMGRLVNQEGVPLKGAYIVNHAGRSVTEADGFFALEMSEATPTLDIRHKELGAGCQFALDAEQYKREAGRLMVGDVSCPAAVVQAATADNQSQREEHQHEVSNLERTSDVACSAVGHREREWRAGCRNGDHRQVRANLESWP